MAAAVHSLDNLKTTGTKSTEAVKKKETFM